MTTRTTDASKMEVHLIRMAATKYWNEYAQAETAEEREAAGEKVDYWTEALREAEAREDEDADRPRFVKYRMATHTAACDARVRDAEEAVHIAHGWFDGDVREAENHRLALSGKGPRVTWEQVAEARMDELGAEAVERLTVKMRRAMDVLAAVQEHEAGYWVGGSGFAYGLLVEGAHVYVQGRVMSQGDCDAGTYRVEILTPEESAGKRPEAVAIHLESAMFALEDYLNGDSNVKPEALNV